MGGCQRIHEANRQQMIELTILKSLSGSNYYWRLFLVTLVFVSVGGCSNPIGEEFQHIDSIGMSKTWNDWVIVGRFDPNGPFELVEINKCEYSEPCSLSHNGTGHTYDKFYGFKRTVLRLESPHGEVSHVVLRSKDKQYGAN